MMRLGFLILLWMVCLPADAQKRKEKQTSTLRVLIFMAVDCPVTQKYMNTLKELSWRYSDRVVFTGYFPAGLTKKQEAEFRKEFDVPKSIELKDDKQHVITDQYHATITPEVVLLDRNLQVAYQGAIDNWFYELGRYRLEITENYLKDAIEATLNNQQPIIKKTQAVGCFIQGTTKKSEPHHH
jgi:thiol-disulfide isomerase/thioredoxin